MKKFTPASQKSSERAVNILGSKPSYRALVHDTALLFSSNE